MIGEVRPPPFRVVVVVGDVVRGCRGVVDDWQVAAVVLSPLARRVRSLRPVDTEEFPLVLTKRGADEEEAAAAAAATAAVAGDVGFFACPPPTGEPREEAKLLVPPTKKDGTGDVGDVEDGLVEVVDVVDFVFAFGNLSFFVKALFRRWL